jgi:hypothetical protein
MKAFSEALLPIALAMTLAGCENDPPEPPPPPAAALTATAKPSPVDHVDSNEIPEGTEKAFGLPIPRVMRVERRFSDAVHARGDVSLDVAASYVSARVVAAHVEKSPAKTVFSGATLKSDPSRTLSVELVAYGDRTDLIVRDVTRPAGQSVVSPTDPWYKPGFDPKDRKADPKRFE